MARKDHLKSEFWWVIKTHSALGAVTPKLEQWLQQIPGSTSEVSVKNSTVLGITKTVQNLQDPGLNNVQILHPIFFYPLTSWRLYVCMCLNPLLVGCIAYILFQAGLLAPVLASGGNWLSSAQRSFSNNKSAQDQHLVEPTKLISWPWNYLPAALIENLLISEISDPQNDDELHKVIWPMSCSSVLNTAEGSIKQSFLYFWSVAFRGQQKGGWGGGLSEALHD